MMNKYIELKIGKMRKPQDFLIQTVTIAGEGVKKEKHIVLQSGKAIGQLNVDTGEFKFSTKGAYFPHLAFAVPTVLNADVKKKIIEMAGGIK
jgi:hypothetical protein